MEEKTMRELIMGAAEMTKDIPATDVLVPLQQEEQELVPFPEIEYKIVEWNTMDKLIRDVNAHLKNGRQTEWGVQVVSWQTTRFYQSMIRRVARSESDLVAKPEMPSEKSEAECLGTQAGPLWEGMSFLNDEPDLYEDVTEDATNW